MKKVTPNLFFALIMLAIPVAYAAYIYPSLPNTIPTHFNMKGEADGFGERSSIFLGPAILSGVGLFTFFLLSNLKNFDPKKFKPENESMFKQFALFMTGFLSAMGLVIVYASTNPAINITKLLLPLLGFAFAIMGWYMPKLQQNYFAGFKLPWTLENVDNWNATHKLAGTIWLWGGWLQVIAGISLSSKPAFICFMSMTAIMVIIPTIYSYRMFKNGNQPI
ncbi:MAG: hypothetical protein RLZ56_522 [Bacteroidota bacterium]|jgi:uncharacterized membrane protein